MAQTRSAQRWRGGPPLFDRSRNPVVTWRHETGAGDHRDQSYLAESASTFLIKSHFWLVPVYVLFSLNVVQPAHVGEDGTTGPAETVHQHVPARSPQSWRENWRPDLQETSFPSILLLLQQPPVPVLLDQSPLASALPSWVSSLLNSALFAWIPWLDDSGRSRQGGRHKLSCHRREGKTPLAARKTEIQKRVSGNDHDTLVSAQSRAL